MKTQTTPRHHTRATMALLALASAASLGASCSQPTSSAASGGDNGAAVASGGGRRVAIRVSGMEFSPATVAAQPGETVDLVFTREAGPSCVTSVVFHSLGLTKELPEATPVTVSVRAPRSGTLDFTCPYDHAHGSIRVQ